MTRFPDGVSGLFPVLLEPCLPDDDTPPDGSTLSFNEPDNPAFCRLIAPLAPLFYHCGVIRHDAGYDCDVVLLPVAALSGHLKALPETHDADPAQVRRVLKAALRWQSQNVEYLRLTLPQRRQSFGIGQQVWGHEHAGHPPALRKRARTLTGDRCDFCGHTSPANPLIFRDSNPENQTDDNLGLACAVCACSRHLNRLGANDGVMVYLPELEPADISHLLRAVSVARAHGDARQKAGAAEVLRWLTAHRTEAEAFWGTSHPGEFGQALMQAPDRLREDLQQRLRHIALIPNPDLIAAAPQTGATPPAAWRALLDGYHRQP
ncbi:hypothetical protein [Erwinia sp. LJJL01]|uniref:hypothetical protein n=1 Tax=Erwinia sp. LJJL01 TaxID=3391839 RepID=UPI00105ED56F